MTPEPAYPLLLWAYLVTAGLVLYPGIQALWVAALKHRAPLNIAFAGMCFSAAAYQLAQVAFYAADSVPQALLALRMQFNAVGVFLVAFFAFTAIYTELRRARHWFALVALIWAVLLVANALLPGGLRFEALAPARVLTLPWGEQLAHFQGTPGPGNLMARLLVFAILGWALWRALLQFQKGRRRMAALLTICVLMLIASSIWGYLIDLGAVESVYVAGFAYVALALFMSLNLGLELRASTLELRAASASLEQESERRRKSERAIQHIVAGVASETGERFFERLVLELGQLFNAERTFVAVVDRQHPEMARELAVCARGQLVANHMHRLQHSAWATAIGNRALVCTQGARTQYPQDAQLAELEIESLIAMPLFDATTRALGVIVVLHRDYMADPARVVEVLEIFGARAAAEIQRLQDEGHIRRLAYSDPLTGLANRARVAEFLDETLLRARQAHGHGALLLVDLDHFKTINDALSHAVGDQVLIEVAERLRACTGSNFLGRLGGDEFVVVMHELAEDAMQAHARCATLTQRIVSALALPISVGGHVLNVRASIGVAPFPHLDSNALDGLRQAELALYRAKHMGRGLVQFFEAPMQAHAAERLTLEKGLREALAHDALELHFQAQTDAAGSVIGAEALVRWRHPELGAIPPSTFITVAEEAGLIHALGSFVLERACASLARWRECGTPLPGRLSVNVSPWQFTRPDFVEQILGTLGRQRVAPGELTIEITEGSLLYDVDDAVAKLKELRSKGFEISLDDFGTGYSSLAYLKTLPLDELKIDQSFVADLAAGGNNGLVQAMIAVGHHMGLQVIAEGVETPTQRDLLVTMGVQRFQGYLFAKPLAEKEFLARMRGLNSG